VFGKRVLRAFLAGGVVVLAAVAFALTRLGEPELVPVAPAVTGDVTIAGQTSIEQAGKTLSAHLTISADRVVTLHKLTVRLRDTAGGFHDFLEMANVELTTTPREIVLNTERTAPGDYTYYLAYQLGTDWISLPPWQTITIH
jgi:hypothetical protein